MARNLSEASEEYVNLVQEIVDERTSLGNYVNVRVYRLVKLGKDVIKIQKANELGEKLAEEEDILGVFIFEEIFDMVEDQTKRLWIENALAQVHFDDEHDRLEIGKEPSITLPLGMYENYKRKGLQDELINQIQLQALSVQQYKDNEKKKKQEEKERKKAEKKFKKQ